MADSEDIDALVSGHIAGKKWADVRQLLGHIATIFERQSCGRWSRKTAERKARAFYVALIRRIGEVQEGQHGGRLWVGDDLEVLGVHFPGAWVHFPATPARQVKNGFGKAWEVPARPARAEWVPGRRELAVYWSKEWTRKHWGPDGPKEAPGDLNFPPPEFVRLDPEAGGLN